MAIVRILKGPSQPKKGSKTSGMPSSADNIADDIIKENIIRFVDRPGTDVSMRPLSSSRDNQPAKPNASIQRINHNVLRVNFSVKVRSKLTDAGKRLGNITVFGDQQDISSHDKFRQGVNIKRFEHFGKRMAPMLTVGTRNILAIDGTIDHRKEECNFGQGNMHHTFDNRKQKFIAFQDIPGRLDPVAYVKAGNYILQYMIVNDLKRDIDNYVNPDSMDGVIEIFDVRKQESFYNTADIKIKGVRTTYETGDWNFDRKGSSPVENKFEKNQVKHDYYEDAQDVSHELFRRDPGETKLEALGKISKEGFVSEGFYTISPFNESGDSTSNQLVFSLRNFLVANNVTLMTGALKYSASIQSERDISEIGTRYNSATTGFTFQNVAVQNKISGFKTNLSMDSIAFGGLFK